MKILLTSVIPSGSGAPSEESAFLLDQTTAGAPLLADFARSGKLRHCTNAASLPLSFRSASAAPSEQSAFLLDQTTAGAPLLADFARSGKLRHCTNAASLPLSFRSASAAPSE